MIQFLEKTQLNANCLQGKIRHLSFREIEFVIKNLHTREHQTQMISLANSIKYPSRFHIPCFLYKERKLINVSFIIEGERKCCNSFCEARITVLPKLDKDSIGKEQHKQMFLMDVDAKILHDILAN